MTNDRLNEARRRTLASLDSFDGTGKALRHLSSSLKANIAELESWGEEPTRCDALRNHRAEIEFTNAIAIESGIDILSPIEVAEINSSLAAMGKLFREY